MQAHKIKSMLFQKMVIWGGLDNCHAQLTMPRSLILPRTKSWGPSRDPNGTRHTQPSNSPLPAAQRKQPWSRHQPSSATWSPFRASSSSCWHARCLWAHIHTCTPPFAFQHHHPRHPTGQPSPNSTKRMTVLRLTSPDLALLKLACAQGLCSLP